MAEDDAGRVRDESKEGMDKAIRSLRAELQRVRTGRASTSLLDGILIDYYGTPTPLNQLANLTAPDPRLIVISPYDKGSLQGIEKAIQASDLGLTPANDGKVVRVPVPPLTEERRKQLVKHVHRLAEDHKLGVRDARRDGLSLLKDLTAVPQDDRHREEKKIQRLTDDYIKKIDEMVSQKEREILQV
ncbi:MAG: ribosome recycling factor [Myxococcota bacterium]